jgi:hypothetical protein
MRPQIRQLRELHWTVEWILGKGKTIEQMMSADFVHIWAFHGRTGIVYMCEQQ